MTQLIWASLWENRLFAYAKTKMQISFAVTAKLISAFVFAIRIVQTLIFLNQKFQASSNLLSLHSPVCVGPGLKSQRPVFSWHSSYIVKFLNLYTTTNFIWAASWENQLFAYAKTKTQISFVVTAKLISAFVFATLIVQALYFLNPKFQASNHLLWLYSLACVGPDRKPWRPVFSQRGSF